MEKIEIQEFIRSRKRRNTGISKEEIVYQLRKFARNERACSDDDLEQIELYARECLREIE